MSLLTPLALGIGLVVGQVTHAASNRQEPVQMAADTGAGPAPDLPAETIEPGAGPQPLADGVQVRSVGGAEARPPGVDISLLRYLAGRGDRAAAEAEIARLQAANPGWEPPDDLFGPARPTVDVAPLWALYEAGDYGGLRQAIARLQAENGGWQPPADLLALTEASETRSLLQQAAGARDWRKVIEIAEAFPRQIGCSHVDNMWRLAEARARTGDREAAGDIYADILRSCGDGDQRFATLQKAKDLLGAGPAADLAALEFARGPDGPQRRRVEALIAVPKPAAASPQRPRELTRLYARNAGVDEAVAATTAAREARDAAAASKIGWLLFDARRLDEAAEWFATALEWKGGSDAAKGLATVYAAQGNLPALEQLGKRWPAIVGPMLADARGTALAAALERNDWRAVLTQTRGAEAVPALLTRGWALFQLGRPTEAMLGFQRVLHSDDATPTQRDEGAYGLVRSYLSLDLYQDAERAMERYGVDPGKVFEVKGELLAKAASEAFTAEDYRRVILLLEQRQAVAEPDRGLLMQEAWARYHTGDLRAAKQIFASQHRLLATPETTAGMRAVESRLDPN